MYVLLQYLQTFRQISTYIVDVLSLFIMFAKLKSDGNLHVTRTLSEAILMVYGCLVLFFPEASGRCGFNINLLLLA